MPRGSETTNFRLHYIHGSFYISNLSTREADLFHTVSRLRNTKTRFDRLGASTPAIEERYPRINKAVCQLAYVEPVWDIIRNVQYRAIRDEYTCSKRT
jgi:hypothetical protein